jgi:3-phosphoshikimate 1-carboxyvinyltransferase
MHHASADPATVQPAVRVAGRVRVPGDKSISHRYAMLAAIADGSSTIHGYLPGADCVSTLDCLRALGVAIRRTPAGTALDVTVEGRGLNGLTAPATPLDAGNSGTTMRLMAGLVAAHPFRTVIGGDASLSRRPMKRVIAPLTQMGAAITAQDGRPPLTIDGARLRGITYTPDVPSAQVKSAILLAGIQAEGETTVLESVGTRDHTERALRAFGMTVTHADGRIHVTGGQRLKAGELTVPGDVSSAAFWMALAAGTPGASIDIEGVGVNPTRTGMIEIVRRAGAIVEIHRAAETAGEPVGRIHVAYGSPRSFEIAPSEVPGVIDEIPALAALGALLPPGQEMSVRGASELRVKESDRITCLARGLRTLGSTVDEYPDGFRLVAQPLAGGIADAVDDHRLAMAFAIAATGAKGPTMIQGAASVDVSYPGFFEALERLTR